MVTIEIVQIIAFILNISAFVEVAYGVILWFTETNIGLGKIWVGHGLFLAFLATILLIGV